MTNAVTQGNSNTTAITNALERTMRQFADALQQTIQMGIDAQAQENKNARMDKQFEKVKVFDGSKPSKCHPWLEEVHALCVVRRRGRLAPRQPLSVCTLLPAYEGNRHLRPLGNLGHRLRRLRWID